jgi:hypothetical protein
MAEVETYSIPNEGEYFRYDDWLDIGIALLPGPEPRETPEYTYSFCHDPGEGTKLAVSNDGENYEIIQ